MKTLSAHLTGGILLMAAGVMSVSPAFAHDPARVAYADGALAVSEITHGKLAEAEKVLTPRFADDRQDPAKLINLGITYSRAGKVNEAREAFAAAAKAPECDVILSDGSEVSSRTVVRQQLASLDARALASR